MFTGTFNRRNRWRRFVGWGSVGAGLLLTLALITQLPKPFARPVSETPIAFWAWQNQAPVQGEVQAAIDTLNAGSIFLRAGQIDFDSGKLQRIREVQGTLPRGVDLHMVYNATRSTLAQFEQVKLKKLATLLVESFQADCRRALNDGAVVVGLQLDFDVPTRLLSRYVKFVHLLRGRLKSNAQVSITGLPTWMQSRELPRLLDEVSFWIPQCYGALIPQRLDVLAPIVSPSATAAWIEKARKLGRPFYAGLAAYGYAIHYSRAGELLEVRGDLDPALVAGNVQLERIERRLFEANQQAGEWRYVYRAVSDVLIDELAMQAGEYLMLDMPGSDSLRGCARLVRWEGGEMLLGICIFRLPGVNDKTNLSLPEIACALQERTPAPQVKMAITAQKHPPSSGSLVTITISNSGTAAAIFDEEALIFEMNLPENSLRSLKTDNALRAETFFDRQPCAARRANRLRLCTRGFPVGARVEATLELENTLPETFETSISMRLGEGQVWRDQQVVAIHGEVKP